jgi:hypothetical protein
MSEQCPKCGAVSLQPGSWVCGSFQGPTFLVESGLCLCRQKNTALHAEVARLTRELEEEREAKEVLKDALHEAQWTVQFLHCCLTEPKTCKYEYPEQTLQRMEEWSAIAPCPTLCLHSRFHDDCPACVEVLERNKRKAALTAPKEPEHDAK